MAVKMTWRWFGATNDHITPAQIRQVPGVGGLVWALHDIPAGQPWPLDRIQAELALIQSAGFHGEVVESVNVSDAIKIGLPERDAHIGAYATTLRRLASAGVKVICYNFMPVFDWIRTELRQPLPDGSTALFYEKAKAEQDPRALIASMLDGSAVFTLPGWEPERLGRIEALLEAYREVDHDRLMVNYRYFLDRIIPVCEDCGLSMAVHPDDPPWPMYGLPRLLGNAAQIREVLALHPSPRHGLTLCSGSLGANPANNIPAMVREFGPRIHFAHIRNVRRFPNGDFIETSHLTSDGSLDIAAIVEAYHQVGFQGYVRPDHGRHLWGEDAVCRPGYGLYDRALGIMYLLGLWDAFARGASA